MKSVLISIRPKWCVFIASGQKTVEVRKTRPKIECPFKCYIYCTRDWHNALIVRNGQAKKIICDNSGTAIYCGGYQGNGKVIGEFVCDRILEIDCDSVAPYDYETTEYIDGEICFGRDELIKYAGYMRTFGWHISNLVIYDKPRELSEFRHCGANYHYNPTVSHPPRSWCYVEEARR